MLFKFGKGWKTLLFLLCSWGIYGFYGHEFAIVTLLALLYSQNFEDTHGLL